MRVHCLLAVKLAADGVVGLGERALLMPHCESLLSFEIREGAAA